MLFLGGVGFFALLILAGAIVLHRIRPAIALGIVAVLPALLLAFSYTASTPTVSLWVPVLFSMFGAAAYRREVTRWLRESWSHHLRPRRGRRSGHPRRRERLRAEGC